MKVRERKMQYVKIILLSFLAILLFMPFVRASAVEGTYSQDEARSMLEYINEFRKGSEAWYWSEDNSQKVKCKNLEDLIYDYELEKVAMLRAKEIAESFSHTRPNGESCFTAYKECGYDWVMRVGENIAAGQSSAYSVYMDWREDGSKYSGQGHRRNMLGKDYKAIGIGCYVVNGRKYWVQEFTGNTPTGSALIPPDDANGTSEKPEAGKNENKDIENEESIKGLISRLENFEVLLLYDKVDIEPGKVKLTKTLMAKAAALSLEDKEEIYSVYLDDYCSEYYYSFTGTALTKAGKDIFGKKLKKKNLTSKKYSNLRDAYKSREDGYVIMISTDMCNAFTHDIKIKKSKNKYTVTKTLFWQYGEEEPGEPNYKFTYTLKKSNTSAYGFVVTGLKFERI